MTRKELITACVDNQVERGIVKPENRDKQIAWRLKGYAGLKAMNKEECERWYKVTFGEARV